MKNLVSRTLLFLILTFTLPSIAGPILSATIPLPGGPSSDWDANAAQIQNAVNAGNVAFGVGSWLIGKWQNGKCGLYIKTSAFSSDQYDQVDRIFNCSSPSADACIFDNPPDGCHNCMGPL